MEENKGQQSLYTLFQGLIYLSILLEIFCFSNIEIAFLNVFKYKLANLIMFSNIIYSKLFTCLIILIVSIGSKPKKQVEIDTNKKIVFPILIGLIILILSVVSYLNNSTIYFYTIPLNICIYILFSFIGAILLNLGFDNISKIIKSSFMKDRFNKENESFKQTTKISTSDFSVNIPMLFYWNKKVRKGWFNITNVFRGTMVIGTPGSGKTFGVIVPFIKQLIAKGFTGLIYDYKFPDLSDMVYHHYKMAKLKNPKLKFHVINLSEVEKSRRVNPLHVRYLETINDAKETSENLVRSLTKSDGSGGGAEQFFTQSAINFLTAVIYFFAKYQKGKYSTFAHVSYFLSRSYQEMFDVLYTNDELEDILAPFRDAYMNESYSQLDGQIGTIRINISNLSTKENAWVFTGDDVNLKLSDRDDPSLLVIANLEKNASANSASNALILNRITGLLNTEGNLPSMIVVDEAPTVYVHKIDNVISTARSKKVAVLIGFQELPQLVIKYGKNTADVITSVIGNVVSGAARKGETLKWLQGIFGKVKQKKESISIAKNSATVSINEQMDFLIPESKISALRQGEIVAQLVTDENDVNKDNHGKYNCKMNLDIKQIKEEEENYSKTPIYYDFGNNKEQILLKNFNKIKNDIKNIIEELT